MKTSKSELNLSSLNKDAFIMSKPINIYTSRSGIINRNNLSDQNNQTNDLSYSMYLEKSESSMSVSPDITLNSIFPKKNDKWVDSSLVYKCQGCAISFGLFTRKHHCRACGGVFCSYCCNKYIDIPRNIIDIPQEDNTIKVTLKKSLRWLYGETKELTCNNCDKKIKDLKDIEYLIKICEYLDLKTLYIMKKVSKNFRIASLHVLSKFRDIQYGSHLKIYSQWDDFILWNSYQYLLIHSVWLTIIIKNCLYHTMKTKNDNRLKIIYESLNNSKKYKSQKCMVLLCSRKCTHNLEFDDIIEIFDYIKFIISEDENILDFDVIKSLILLLTEKLLSITKLYIIIPILSNIFMFLFDYEQINLDKVFIKKLFSIFFINDHNKDTMIMNLLYEHNFHESINKNVIEDNDNFLNMITKYIISVYGLEYINDILKMNTSITNIINDTVTDFDFPFTYPFNPSYKIISIINKHVIKSNTKPILLEVYIKHNKDNIKKNVKFIIKKDKNLRKEQIIACLIDILQLKINKFNFELIPTYKIIMINKDIGLLEFIDNAVTLRSISDKGFTLQNYILNQNMNNKLDIIKTRFVHSLAISNAIAYIIGIGDRHLDNIMINTNGQIFHIDYGYIMENPIGIFNMPEIKVTNDIIDFLGGINSLYYDEFKKLIVKIYNLYRANKNILYIYFKYICDSGYLNWQMVSNKLDSKLMIGMKCKDVEITLINEIESGNSFTDMISDMCHSYKHKMNSFIS